MPTTLLTFAAGEVRQSWREPYVTEGFNARLAAVIPQGVYRGFRLAASGPSLKIVSDPTWLDHVAVVESVGAYSLTLHRMGGDLTFAAPAAGTYLVTLYANYVVQVDTKAEIRLYTQTEYNSLDAGTQSSLVQLGTVVSSGAAITSIDYTNREAAWTFAAKETDEWVPILQNPNFDVSPTGAQSAWTTRGWEIISTQGTWTTGSADPGQTNKYLEYGHPGGSITCSLRQQVSLPVVPGQLIRLRAVLKRLATASGGTVSALAEYGDATGAPYTPPAPATISVATNATDAAYTTLEQTFVVPTGAFYINNVRLDLLAVVASAGPFVRVDQLQLWVEPYDVKHDPARESGGRSVVARPLVIESVGGILSALAALLRYDETTPAGKGTLYIEQRNGGTLGPLLRAATLFLGHGDADTLANALTSRIISPIWTSSSSFSLLWESSTASGTVAPTRIYYGDGLLSFSVNARWDGTNWNRDVAGRQAVKLSLGASAAGGLYLFARNDATPTWDDSYSGAGWTYAPIQFSAALLSNTITGLLNLGADRLSTAADALQPRLALPVAPAGTSAYTLLVQAYSATNSATRFYADPDGALCITTNASWDGSQWLKDATGFEAIRLTIGHPTTGPGQFKIEHRTPDGSGWADGAWTGTDLSLIFSTQTLTVPNVNGTTQVSSPTITATDVATLNRANIGSPGTPATSTGQLSAASTIHTDADVTADRVKIGSAAAPATGGLSMSGGLAADYANIGGPASAATSTQLSVKGLIRTAAGFYGDTLVVGTGAPGLSTGQGWLAGSLTIGGTLTVNGSYGISSAGVVAASAVNVGSYGITSGGAIIGTSLALGANGITSGGAVTGTSLTVGTGGVTCGSITVSTSYGVSSGGAITGSALTVGTGSCTVGSLVISGTSFGVNSTGYFTGQSFQAPAGYSALYGTATGNDHDVTIQRNGSAGLTLQTGVVTVGSGFHIGGVVTPTADDWAANKSYVDTKVSTAGLGFTPVQQGGGTGQLTNKVYMGWSGSRVKVQIDATDMGNAVFDAHLVPWGGPLPKYCGWLVAFLRINTNGTLANGFSYYGSPAGPGGIYCSKDGGNTYTVWYNNPGFSYNPMVFLAPFTTNGGGNRGCTWTMGNSGSQWSALDTNHVSYSVYNNNGDEQNWSHLIYIIFVV